MSTTSAVGIATRSGLPRRSFLTGAVAASAALTLGRRPAGAAEGLWTENLKPAGERVNLACCGIGHQGAADIRSLYNTGLANIVALCDTDMGAAHTRSVLEKFPDVPRFQDFRRMFDEMGKEIEAVCIATPDFSHFPIAMLAMSLGKHVYVEKPLAHTFHETALMMQAATKRDIVTQMGNQGHSGAGYHQFKAWTEAGIFNDVTSITAFMNERRRWHGWKIDGYPAEQPIPETLDWDAWLGTAQPHAYNKDYVGGQWRCWYDFGNGALGDWGAHILDAAHEFLDLGLPEEVSAVAEEGPNSFIFPQASTLLFKFPARGKLPPVEVTWYDGQSNPPPLLEELGEENGGKRGPGIVIRGEGPIFRGGSHGRELQIFPAAKAKEMKAALPRYATGSNHHANFLLACKGKERCRSPFEVSGPLSQVLMLGVIAQRLNTTLVFDRSTNRITNNKVADELLVGPPPRKGWEEFYTL